MKGQVSVMNTRVGLSFRPKACMRCGGDAYLNRGEDNEWVCLQCGRTITVAQPSATGEVDSREVLAQETAAKVAA
jgi:ribosomal protein L37AE/L43A